LAVYVCEQLFSKVKNVYQILWDKKIFFSLKVYQFTELLTVKIWKGRGGGHYCSTITKLQEKWEKNLALADIICTFTEIIQALETRSPLCWMGGISICFSVDFLIQQKP